MVIEKELYEICVGAYTVSFFKSPHGRFLYVKTRVWHFLVNADYYKGKLRGNFLNTKALLLYSIPIRSYYR